MKLSTAKMFIAAVLLVGLLVWTNQAMAAFYGYDGKNRILYDINPSTPSATQIGASGGSGSISEIEYRNGVIYGADTDTGCLRLIDPATGAFEGTLALTFPSEGNAITALQFVGDTLYGGLATGRGERAAGQSYLVTINTTTGVVSLIGNTGMGYPLGGLAYDGVKLYGISAGGGTAVLYTLDVSTGAATSVGTVRIDGNNFSATALEYAESGKLYSLPNGTDPLAGHLIFITTADASAVDLGDTGQRNLNSLTSTVVPPPPIPTLSEWGMILLGLILGSLALWTLQHRKKHS